MFKNMFKKALKIGKGRRWAIPDKKGRQKCYMPDKCNIFKI